MVPLEGKFMEVIPRLGRRGRSVNRLQVCGDFLSVLVGNILQGMPEKVNHAQLYLCAGEDRLDRFR
jgi:hypothetical protein